MFFLILMVAIGILLVFIGSKRENGIGLKIGGFIMLAIVLLITVFTGTAERLGSLLIYAAVIYGIVSYLKAKKEKKQAEIERNRKKDIENIRIEALKYDQGDDVTPKDQVKAYQLFCEAAEGGDLESYYYIGYYYEYGLGGVEKNIHKALEYYEKLVNEWKALITDFVSDAAYRVGKFYRFGTGGIEEYPEKAVKYFKKTEDLYGKYLLGRCYESGYGTSRDLKAAFTCYFRARFCSEAKPRYHLGRCYMYGLGTTTSKDEGLYWLHSAKCRDPRLAEACNQVITKSKKKADAEYKKRKYEGAEKDVKELNDTLSEYLILEGIEKVDDTFAKGLWDKAVDFCGNNDEKNTVKYVLLSAAAGYAEAQYIAGVIYDHGYIEKYDNTGTACYWYKKALDQGYIHPSMEGYHTLVRYEPEYAKKMLKLGAEIGSSIACSIIGDQYFFGTDGLSVDKKQAAEWYEKAAEKENGHALYQLGRMYENGDGVISDYGHAVDLYCRSAETGDVKGCYEYGFASLKKWLQKKDGDALKEASIYLQYAVEENYPLALYTIGRLAEQSKHKDKAYFYYEKASSLGYVDAHRKMLAKYIEEKNNDMINSMLEKIAESGDQTAQKVLAEKYRTTIITYKIHPGMELSDKVRAELEKVGKAIYWTEELMYHETDQTEKEKYKQNLNMLDRYFYLEDYQWFLHIDHERLTKELDEDERRREEQRKKDQIEEDRAFLEKMKELASIGLGDYALRKTLKRFKGKIKEDPWLLGMLADIDPHLALEL